MASRVTYSTILSQAWQNVYDVINNRSYVADPQSTSTEFRKFVYEREPKTKAAGFAGYPFIIVHPAEVAFGSKSYNQKSGFVDWSVEVEVISSDVGGPTTQGKGNEHMNNISDDIIQTFMNAAIRNTLRANGLSHFEPDATSVTVEPIDDTMVFRRSFLVSFRTRMTVST